MTPYRSTEEDTPEHRQRQNRQILALLGFVLVISALANIGLNLWGSHLLKQRCMERAEALGPQWSCYGKEERPGIWKYTVEDDSKPHQEKP